MKKLTILLISMSVLVGCSDSLDAKKEKLKKAKSEMVELNKKITDIEKEIAALDTSKTEVKTTPVEILELKKQEFNHFVEIHGVVEASKNILGHPEAAGTITAINVREGQKVTQGQIIATIDASILQRGIEEVKKSLEFVTTVFDKQKRLNEKGVGTEIQFLEAKNQKESLEKKLSTMRSQLDQYNVRAPISGYVDEIIPKVGEMASPQMPIVRIVNLEKVFVNADVSEALLGKVNENDVVDVEFPSLKKTIKGRIVQTGHFINANNRTFKLKIDLSEQSNMFKPNLLTIVRLNDYSAKESIVIPSTTIQEDLKGAYVFVKEGDKARKKNITTGISFQGYIEVLSGIEEGNLLITKGYKTLVNEEIVSVSNNL